MKRVSLWKISVILIVALASVVLAEVPLQISYQDRLTESDGSPVDDGVTVGLATSIAKDIFSTCDDQIVRTPLP